MTNRIPVSVLVTTLNEAENLPRCLSALQDFSEIIVIDSGSRDGTAHVAASFGAQVIDFKWNGQYPKKRQWCLDNLDLAQEQVFFVDADEVVTPELTREIAALDWTYAGYFVKGRYVWNDKILRRGLTNNKLALFDRRRMAFPAVDDLDIPGMGEIEGHYQPVPHQQGEKIGKLGAALLHYAANDPSHWQVRHERYAVWEAEMIRRGAYPLDPSPARQKMKEMFRQMPFRGSAAFLHSYILKYGFMDGPAGLAFAKARAHYYQQVSRQLSEASKSSEKPAEPPTKRSA